MAEIIPDFYMPSTFLSDYKLSEPEFYQSLISNSEENSLSIYFSIFGISVITILTMNYLLKACLTVKNVSYQQYGQIIPHLLALKAPIFIIYPLFP